MLVIRQTLLNDQHALTRERLDAALAVFQADDEIRQEGRQEGEVEGDQEAARDRHAGMHEVDDLPHPRRVAGWGQAIQEIVKGQGFDAEAQPEHGAREALVELFLWVLAHGVDTPARRGHRGRHAVERAEEARDGNQEDVADAAVVGEQPLRFVIGEAVGGDDRQAEEADADACRNQPLDEAVVPAGFQFDARGRATTAGAPHLHDRSSNNEGRDREDRGIEQVGQILHENLSSVFVFVMRSRAAMPGGQRCPMDVSVLILVLLDLFERHAHQFRI